jgi:hypothetical protein
MLGDDLAAFARLVEALRPWHDRLVIVGGWSHRLHRLHDMATPPDYLPLSTKDADVAFSLNQSPHGDIRAALESAGFEEVLSGDHRPPVAEYRLGGVDAGFFAEFLAPLAGSGQRRDGTGDATVVRAGVTAQKLRHLGVLLTRPWTVTLDVGGEIPVSVPTEIRIANPVCFIAQKLLIRNQREPRKRAQDVLYIHDTLELFGAHRDVLGAMWVHEIRPHLGAKVARQIERLCLVQFEAVDDVIRDAARIPVDRSLSPTDVRAECAYGLEEIFGAARLG